MNKKPRTNRKSAPKNNDQTPLPSKDEILEFIQTSPGKVGKREIARAFHIRGGQRIALKRILKEMAQDGLIEGSRKTLRQPGQISKVAIIEIFGRDDEGEFIGRPVKWDEAAEGPVPTVLIGAKRGKAGKMPGMGDRVLSQITKLDQEADGYAYLAQPIKVLPRDDRRMLGIYRLTERGAEIQPIDKKQLKSWHIRRDEAASDGELVAFELSQRGRGKNPDIRITERLGNPQDQGLISLIAIETHGIPHHFSEALLQELDHLPDLKADGREDIRSTPLITIDPADARDHDDAVWAAPDDDPSNEGGWVVIVAIADVSFYVRPGSLLDKEAVKRGNSVYFPDRVVPMLPEKISNDLCSLRELEDRPALAVELVFDKNGRKVKHSFKRVLMKSAAKLSYNQAQAAIDGHPDEKTQPLLEPILKPLWSAYEAVRQARDERAPLELDLPERKILMDEKGKIKDIITPDRLDAHKLIEEFMIQANVAAAETLEKKRSPLIYRVHDEPSEEKIHALNEFLETVDFKLGGSGPMRAHMFNGVLRRARGKEIEEMVTEVVLRSQAQAEYNPTNLGHFGLNLQRYAHFTSPIRRYADLIVHRALVRALALGEGGLKDDAIEELDEVAAQISTMERRAMMAERETTDRLIASFLSTREGAVFKGRISGVTRSGLFVKLDDTGADGFIPISKLGSDYFVHDEAAHALVGERSGETYHIGQRVEVRLVEVVPTAGAMRFEMISDGVAGQTRRRRDNKGDERGGSRFKRSSTGGPPKGKVRRRSSSKSGKGGKGRK
ncbi:MAG: ribonuclease R [Rhodomicrobium sp.]|nr:MAG: ribonuclease R [Rhodomicrobium sp.]